MRRLVGCMSSDCSHDARVKSTRYSDQDAVAEAGAAAAPQGQGAGTGTGMGSGMGTGIGTRDGYQGRVPGTGTGDGYRDWYQGRVPGMGTGDGYRDWYRGWVPGDGYRDGYRGWVPGRAVSCADTRRGHGTCSEPTRRTGLFLRNEVSRRSAAAGAPGWGRRPRQLWLCRQPPCATGAAGWLCWQLWVLGLLSCP